MSMTTKQAMRDARQLFRLCIVNRTLDEKRVRQVVQSVIHRRRGYLAAWLLQIGGADRAQHMAKVESAELVLGDLRTTG